MKMTSGVIIVVGRRGLFPDLVGILFGPLITTIHNDRDNSFSHSQADCMQGNDRLLRRYGTSQCFDIIVTSVASLKHDVSFLPLFKGWPNIIPNGGTFRYNGRKEISPNTQWNGGENSM
ncbi:hypothetical protein J6590_017217 [Homalodisca vitripennis]|nr:hypothetical protein J6590_017217 [Homalodisca vitripennis]